MGGINEGTIVIDFLNEVLLKVQARMSEMKEDKDKCSCFKSEYQWYNPCFLHCFDYVGFGMKVLQKKSDGKRMPTNMGIGDFFQKNFAYRPELLAPPFFQG